MSRKDNNAQEGFNTLAENNTSSTALQKTGDANVLTSTTGSVFAVDVEQGSSGGDMHFKLYDAASITYGTTAPVLSVPVGNSGRQTIFCNGGIVFSTACTVAGALTNGGTGAAGDGNATAPSYMLFGGA